MRRATRDHGSLGARRTVAPAACARLGLLAACASLGLLAACGGDAATPDAGAPDARVEAGPHDACTLGTDDCSPDASCLTTVESYLCICHTGFVGGGRGAGGCVWDDPRLERLEPSAGELLAPLGTTSFHAIVAPAGVASLTVQLAAAHADASTITVDGAPFTSGTSTAPIAVGAPLAPTHVAVRVTAASGRARDYVLAVARRPTYAKSPLPLLGDFLGVSVAVSADGHVVLAGASQLGLDGNGMALVFEPTSAITMRTTPTGNPADDFGVSTAVSADGRIAVVGADRVWGPPARTGAVYVFVPGAPLVTLRPPAPSLGAAFGTSLALSVDAATIAVGAPGDESSAVGIGGDLTRTDAPASGAAYLFSPDGTLHVYVKASNTDPGDHFGTSVALSADGTVLVVGAPDEASSATGVDGDESDDVSLGAGAAYVYAQTAGAWHQVPYLKASNTGMHDAFGTSVAVSADGSVIAVGAAGESSASTGVGGSGADDSAPGAGAVYVFVHDAAGFSERAYVKASNAGAGDAFGATIALDAAGDLLAVGAPLESSASRGVGSDGADDDASHAGAVYVFHVGAAVAQTALVKAPNAGAGDAFGAALALSGDGRALVVGALNEDSDATGFDGDWSNDSFSDSGAVYELGP